MVSLFAVTAYGRGAGSARVRVFDWIDHLGINARASTYLGASRNSMKTVIKSPMAVLHAERELRRLTASVQDGNVLLSRQASPFSNGKIESRLLSSAARGIYDFDDALMNSPSRIREQVWSRRRAWHSSVRAADIVIAGNAYLAERAAEFNQNVVIIPSCVDVDSYPNKVNYEITDHPRVVWVGTPGGERYVADIAEPLLALHKAKGLRLSIVSAGSASLGPLDEMVDRWEWSPGVAAREMLRADAGIMPVDDSPWSRGKCAYKLLQYGAVGLPLIGSPVGANDRVLAAGDGLSPSSPREWYEAIESLLVEGEERRAKRGARARHLVDTEYSFSAWESAWTDAAGLSTEDLRADGPRH